MENEDRLAFYRLEDQIRAYFDAKTDCYAEENPWVVPYIGRRVLPKFYEIFTYKPFRGQYYMEFDWQGVERYKELNFYDSETHEHYLSVVLFESGGNCGLIKSIVSHHEYTWETTSNWQDHQERYRCEAVSPSRKEIARYCQILDSCTEDVTDEIVYDLVLNIASHSRAISINWDSKGESVQMPGHEGRIYLTEISAVVRYGRSFFDVFIHPSSRIHRGVSNADLERRGVGDIIGQGSLADLYGGTAELKEQIDRYLTLELKKRGAQFDGNCDEKLAWMASEVMLVEGKVNHRAQYKMSYNYLISSHCVEFHFKQNGSKRYSSYTMSPVGTLCFFNKTNRCVGYVFPDKRIHDVDYNDIGIVSNGQNCKYWINKHGWFFDAYGVYVGCAGILCEIKNVGVDGPFATSKRIVLLRENDSRLNAMNLFDFS